MERAYTRPGDDCGSDLIAVTLVHSSTPYAAAAYLHGRELAYTERGWLRCPTSSITVFRQPGHAMLTHVATALPLPEDVGVARPVKG